jgi:hypothetical protein
MQNPLNFEHLIRERSNSKSIDLEHLLLSMFDSWHYFSFCCSVAFQHVGEDHKLNIAQSL